MFSISMARIRTRTVVGYEVKLFLGVAPEIPIYLVIGTFVHVFSNFVKKLETLHYLRTFIIIQHQPFVIRAYPE